MGARSSGEVCAAHECGDHGALEIGAQVGANGTRWYDGAQWALGGRSGRSKFWRGVSRTGVRRSRSSGDRCAGGRQWYTVVRWCAVGARWAQWALEVLERSEPHGSAAITELWRSVRRWAPVVHSGTMVRSGRSVGAVGA